MTFLNSYSPIDHKLKDSESAARLTRRWRRAAQRRSRLVEDLRRQNFPSAVRAYIEGVSDGAPHCIACFESLYIGTALVGSKRSARLAFSNV